MPESMNCKLGLNVEYFTAAVVPALKNLREMGGGADFDVTLNLKVYPTNFMPFFGQFLLAFGIWGTSPPVSPVAPPLNYNSPI